MNHDKPMPEAPQTGTILSELDTAIVPRHTLQPGQTTGVHQHTLDYVVVPLTDGTVTIESEGELSDFSMQRGLPYARQAGVTHSLTNNGSGVVDFIEVEFRVRTTSGDDG